MDTTLLSAFLIIASPPGTGLDHQLDPVSLFVVTSLAVELQILDRRGVRWIDGEQRDIDHIRSNWQDLYDAPPLCYNEAFPPSDCIWEFLVFNHGYRDHLQSVTRNSALYEEEYDDAIEETMILYRFWDAARDSQMEYMQVDNRRRKLKMAMEIIGKDNFHSLKWPPYVPLWRFTEIP